MGIDLSKSKKVRKLCLWMSTLAILALIMFSAHVSIAASMTWTQVNTDGFGDANNIKVFTMLVDNGFLYAGTGRATTSTGGQIWRTSNGTAWSMVASGGFNDTNNEGIWPHSAFNGYLYAGTYNQNGGQIWRSSNGTTWTAASSIGLNGDTNNLEIGPAVVFGGYLYAGTQNPVTGGEVWRSADGTTWNQVGADGFGDASNKKITLRAVFNGYIYARVNNNTGTGGEVWRSADGTTWSQANTNGFGNLNNNAVTHMTTLNSYLYVGTNNPAQGAEIWRTTDGTTWVQATSGGFGDANNQFISSLRAINGYLYAGTGKNPTGAEVWRSQDGTSWTQVNSDGFGDSNNFRTHAYFEELNGSIFIGTDNTATGGEVWALDVAPTTTLETTPTSPDGGNGWFKTQPTINLTRNEPGSTYMQFDSTSPAGWATGNTTVTYEGEHTLYYFSVDTAGNTETVNSQLIKVDTGAPASFTQVSPSADSTANKPYPYFSWNASTDTVSGLARYVLYIDGSPNSTDVINWTATVPSSALANGAHGWFVRAWDEAGNFRDSATSSLNVNAGPGRITFHSNRTGNADVFIMNPDGSNLTRLTTDTADDIRPTFSPDGSKIAFWSSRDGNAEVYIMNSDGSGQTNISNNVAGDFRPAFSPDGNKLVFMSDRDGLGVQVYSMNIDGSNVVRLTVGPASNYRPVYAPDGATISFKSNRTGNWELFLMNADGSDQTQTTSGLTNVGGNLFSPDGSKIGFHTDLDGDQDLYQMNPDGSNIIHLTDNTLTQEHSIAYAPGGEKVAYARNLIGGDNDIYSMDMDSSNLANLSSNPAQDKFPDWGPGSVSAADGISPSTPVLAGFTPSNTQIALAWAASTDNVGVVGYKIYNADTDTHVATATVTSRTFSGLTPGTFYSYYIKAYDAAGNLSGRSNTIRLDPDGGTTTPADATVTPVTVQPQANVSVTFDDVTSSGETTVAVTPSPPGGPTSGFDFLGNQYDITTTASFAGTITVSLKYNDAQVPGDENDIRLYHFEDGAWKDVTISLDTLNNIVTGEVTSFSPFILVLPIPPATGVNVSFVFMAALAMVGLGVYITRRRNIYFRDELNYR